LDNCKEQKSYQKGKVTLTPNSVKKGNKELSLDSIVNIRIEDWFLWPRKIIPDHVKITFSSTPILRYGISKKEEKRLRNKAEVSFVIKFRDLFWIDSIINKPIYDFTVYALSEKRMGKPYFANTPKHEQPMNRVGGGSTDSSPTPKENPWEKY